MKTLVVFYSRKGSVRSLALQRAEELGADFLELETVTDTTGPAGYVRCALKAVTGGSMPLFPYDKDISSYDKLIIFSPIWADRPANPVMEFVKRERRNIYAADYVFVSMSGRIDEEKLALRLDKILRLDHGSVENAVVPFFPKKQSGNENDAE